MTSISVRTKHRIQAAAAKIFLGGRCYHCGTNQNLEWELLQGERKRTSTGRPLSIFSSEHAEILRILETRHSDKLGLRCSDCRVAGKSKNPDWSFLWDVRVALLEDHSFLEWVAFLENMGVPQDHALYQP